MRKLLLRLDLKKKIVPIVAEMEKGKEGGLRVVIVGGEIFARTTCGGHNCDVGWSLNLTRVWL